MSNRDPADEGGDPPCWAHLLFEDAEVDDDPGDDSGDGGESRPVVVDTRQVADGTGGAVWSLPHGGDLDANLVALTDGDEIGEHRNNEVDVLMVVQAGEGVVTVDGREHHVGPNHLLLVPRGSSRSISAVGGLSYLSIHRRRGPMTIATGRGGE